MVNISDLTRPGQNQSTGDPTALFLKRWSGEVAEAFKKRNVMLPITRVRTIESGRAAQFPATGKLTASYHTPGNNILDTSNSEISEMEVGERIIYIDRLLQSSVFIDDLEEMMNHWDVRGPIAREQGQRLAETADSQLFQLVIKAAQSASGPVTDQPGGTVSNNASYGVTAAATLEGLRVASEALDDNDVPEDNRFAVFGPAAYNLLLETDLVNVELGNVGNGGLASGRLMEAYGFRILKSTNIPTTNVTGTTNQHNTGTGNNYEVDARNTVGLCFRSDVVGTLRLRGIEVAMDELIEYQGHFLIAKNAVGHGVLREEAAVQLRTAVPA